MKSSKRVSPVTTEQKNAENTLTINRFWRLLGLAENKLNLSQWSYFK